MKNKVFSLVIHSASLYWDIDFFHVMHVSEVVLYQLKTKIKKK